MIELSQDEKINLICELIKEYHHDCEDEYILISNEEPKMGWSPEGWFHYRKECFHTVELVMITYKAKPYGISMRELKTFINTVDCVCNRK